MSLSPGEPTSAGTAESRDAPRRRYRDVIILLFGAAAFGAIVALTGGRAFTNQALLDTALALAIAAGILAGVLMADIRRHRKVEIVDQPSIPESADNAVSADQASANASPTDSTDAIAEGSSDATTEGPSDAASETAASADAGTAPVATKLFPDLGIKGRAGNFFPRLSDVLASIERQIGTLDSMDRLRSSLCIAGLAAATLILRTSDFTATLNWIVAAVSAGAYVAAAALAAGAARYLGDVDPEELPEAPGLRQAARVLAWMLLLAAASIGAQWSRQLSILKALHLILWGINVAVSYALGAPRYKQRSARPVFPVALAPFAVLGSRPNLLASVLDAGERQLGIDLRSTWALTIVRRSVEPLILGLALIGWLSTSFTVVGLEDQGLIERLGVPVAGDLLAPGLHIHWPMPIDRIYRIPVQRAQQVGVGHEGEEAPGPENVLWSVEHAPNEFTLLLGNGRDLITVDAAVQYRITNPRAWRYRSQNPETALRALAYRAVMRNTVNRTLTDALSENVATLTQHMREMVQHDADSLGLGVSVIGFTVGGMHPPVAVAPAYEGVVSAEIRKATAVVEAQVYRNQALPAAEAAAIVGSNGARAEAAEALGRAAGEAWSFRALESQYRASPAEYMFRRRLETLEKGLTGHPFTVVDARFLRDGGELWVVP